MLQFREFLQVIEKIQAEDAVAPNNVGGGQIAGYSPILRAMVRRKKQGKAKVDGKR